MQKIFWFCTAFCLGAGVLPAAGQAVEKVRVVLFRVPEKLWQADLVDQAGNTQALWKRLDQKSQQENVQRTLDVQCALPADQTSFEWNRGVEQEFTTSWASDREKIEVTPKKSTRRFVGSQLSAASLGPTPGGRLSVMVRLEHDTRPPLMMKHNYANAAEGKERERLSVEYPQFEKVAWHGTAVVGHEWRLLAQVLHAADEKAEGVAARRYLLFITRIRP